MRHLGFGAFMALLGFAAAGLAMAQEITAAPKTSAPTKSNATPVTPPSSAPASTPAPAAPPSTAILAQAPIVSAGDEPAAKPVAAKAPQADKPPAAPKPPPEPLKRPRFNAAILQGVDKITAETLRFEAKVGEPVRYKGLILTVRACETTAADEDITDSIAHVEVQSQPEVLPGRVAAPPRQVFRGWMFASSPTLHAFEHPVYDLWLVACKPAGA